MTGKIKAGTLEAEGRLSEGTRRREQLEQKEGERERGAEGREGVRVDSKIPGGTTRWVVALLTETGSTKRAELWVWQGILTFTSDCLMSLGACQQIPARQFLFVSSAASASPASDTH